MKAINANTIKGQNFINAYNRSSDRDLFDVYGRYSAEKGRADKDCRRKMIEEGGEDYRIISANTFAFSCAWRTPAGLRVETSVNSYLVN